jgi:hypothetical protein
MSPVAGFQSDHGLDPLDLAGQVAATFPGLTLRTEPAHQEACIHLGQDPQTAAQSQLVEESFRAWAAREAAAVQ